MVVTLLAKSDLFIAFEKVHFTCSVTAFQFCAAEGINAVMIIVDRVALGTGEFVFGAVLAQDGIFSFPVWHKASVVA